MKKHYTPAFKAQIVLEVLKEEKTLAQIASEQGVHPNQLRKWKTQAVEGLPQVFADERKAQRVVEAEHEREREELYAEIGRLTTQLTWLKKKASVLSRVERLALIEREGSEVPLKLQAELLEPDELVLPAGAGPAGGSEAQASNG